MSIIKLSVATLSGSINFVTGSTEEIKVAKDKKAQVIGEGYVGAGRVEKQDGSGDYVASAYGRLPLKAAVAGEKGTESYRLVLDIAGGIRGVLFYNSKKDDLKSKNDPKWEKEPDYTGRVEVDDLEYPLFGRKVKTGNSEFISFNSLEAKPRQQRGNQSESVHDDDDTSKAPF